VDTPYTQKHRHFECFLKSGEQIKLDQGLVERVREHESRKRTEAAARYRELLGKSDGAQTDAAELAELMRLLGRSQADLAEDLELVASLGRAEALAAEADQRRADHQALHAKCAKLLAWADSERTKLEAAIKAKLEPADLECRVAGGRSREAAQAESDLRSLVDRWDSLVTGRAVDAIRDARRAARHAVSIHGPPGPTREDILAQRRHETVALRLQPLDRSADGVLASVNASLAAAGHAPLSEAEIVEHGVRGWLAEADGRVPAEKALEAQASGAA